MQQKLNLLPAPPHRFGNAIPEQRRQQRLLTAKIGGSCEQRRSGLAMPLPSGAVNNEFSVVRFLDWFRSVVGIFSLRFWSFSVRATNFSNSTRGRWRLHDKQDFREVLKSLGSYDGSCTKKILTATPTPYGDCEQRRTGLAMPFPSGAANNDCLHQSGLAGRVQHAPLAPCCPPYFCFGFFGFGKAVSKKVFLTGRSRPVGGF